MHVAEIAFCAAMLALWADARPNFFVDNEASCPWGWQCVPVAECAEAVRAITAGRVLPRRCDFRGFVEFVCCETPSPPPLPSGQRTEAPTTASIATSVPSSAERFTSPSQKACQEYSLDTDNFSNTLELKIVGGEEANEGEFPYMVAIGYTNPKSPQMSWNCGGTLISSRYVLTAAHCISDTRTRGLRPAVLRMGALSLAEGPRRPDDYSVERIEVHPKYAPPQKYFDLALIATDRDVSMSALVRPACLPPLVGDRAAASSARLFAAGWGSVDRSGLLMSPDLKKVELREVTRETCDSLIPSQKLFLPRGLGPSMLCASGVRKGEDTCFGDSGGPLVERSNTVDTLVGVTSFGGNPCAGRRPGVYARVSSELEWIESVVWP